MTSPYVGYRRARVAVFVLTSTSQREDDRFRKGFGSGRAPHCLPNGKSGTGAKHGCRCHHPSRGMPAEMLDPKSQRQGSGELVECPGGAAETERNSRRQGDGRWRKRRGVDDERRYGELPAPPAIEAETRVQG